jgi:steroid delta-isomerase-like uncharacterized protein
MKLLMATTTAILLLTVSSFAQKTESTIDVKIKKYVHVWDEIINRGKLELFNDSNFTANIVIHAGPQDVVGLKAVRDFYANYVTGFSNIKFTVKDCFGQGNKIVKHWIFEGSHTGEFFGIAATGKTVKVDGVTLVRMEGDRIAEEQDFFDNLEFMQQLGLIPR